MADKEPSQTIRSSAQVELSSVPSNNETSTSATSGTAKTCTKCFKQKPLTDFDKNKSKKDGHDSRCKKCVSEAKAKLYKKKERALKERSKFRSVIVGQPSEILHEEFARTLGSAVKEYLDETDQ